MLIDTNVSS